jgi:hypothetical protein
MNVKGLAIITLVTVVLSVTAVQVFAFSRHQNSGSVGMMGQFNGNSMHGRRDQMIGRSNQRSMNNQLCEQQHSQREVEQHPQQCLQCRDMNHPMSLEECQEIHRYCAP